MESKTPSSNKPILHVVLFYAYITTLVVSITVVLFVPEEIQGIRKVAGFLIYGVGLPLIVGISLYFAEKKGWLVMEKKNGKK